MIKYILDGRLSLLRRYIRPIRRIFIEVLVEVNLKMVEVTEILNKL
jgi:hypothetical protein